MKAIVTGHSRGLGAAIAEELLSRSVPVLAISRGRHQDLAGRFPGLLEEVQLDLSDTAALAAWLAGGALETFLAGADRALLVNNAGLLQPVGPVGKQDAAAVARAVSANVAAPLMLATAFAAASEGLADRRILHVSSGAGRSAYPGWSVYCATKAALDHHARATALDQVPGLRICSLAPGVVDTAMQAEIRGGRAELFPLKERFVALKEQGQLVRPEDAAARLVATLLGDRFGEQPVADIRDMG